MNPHQPAKPDRDQTAGKDERERFDTIEEADNRTERLDPERADASSDPIDDLLEMGESNADYEDEARRATPTLGPADQTGNG
jgi:hypothetical protein